MVNIMNCIKLSIKYILNKSPMSKKCCWCRPIIIIKKIYSMTIELDKYRKTYQTFALIHRNPCDMIEFCQAICHAMDC